MDISNLTKTERSLLLYAECCCVDHGGLLVGARMNTDDIVALRKFKQLGMLDFGRIPAAMLTGGLMGETHWVTLCDSGWSLATRLRIGRAAKSTAKRRQVNDLLAERQACHV
jgi:hypothetical protein